MGRPVAARGAGGKDRVHFRGGGFAPRSIPLVGTATFALVLLLWWLASDRQQDLTFLPGPQDVISALAELARSGDLATHASASVRLLLVGWCLGAGCGLFVGSLIGLFSVARSSGLPLVSALFAVPKIAMLPLFIVWFGIGEAAKIATIAIGVFSPMVIATYGGIDGVDRSLIRMAQSFNVPTWSIIRKIVLPGAMPTILAGVRISASIGIILLTGAEMIGAQHGIGALVLMAGNLMRIDRLFAAVVLLAALGLAVSALITLAERYLLRWR
jgi:NitT/TauT family transport system permease protein